MDLLQVRLGQWRCCSPGVEEWGCGELCTNALSASTSAALPHRSPNAAVDDRTADIVSRISLADKYQALGTGTPFLPSIGMAPYQWWSEATHGVTGPGVQYSSALPGALNTGLPITTSCSFNRSMWKATGNAIAREGRAFSNVGQAGLTFWTPVINIVR